MAGRAPPQPSLGDGREPLLFLWAERYDEQSPAGHGVSPLSGKPGTCASRCDRHLREVMAHHFIRGLGQQLYKFFCLFGLHVEVLMSAMEKSSSRIVVMRFLS